MNPSLRGKKPMMSTKIKGCDHISHTLEQGHSIGSERWSYKEEGLEAFSKAIKTLGLKRIWNPKNEFSEKFMVL